MTTLSPSNELIKYIQEEFPNLKVDYRERKLGKGTTHQFFSHFTSEDQLSSTWIKLSNAIAIKFQNKLDCDFGKWNVYLVFLVNFKINKTIKYEIENNIFSSRKLVIEGDQSVDDINANFELSNHFISEIHSKNEQLEFKRNPQIMKAIDGKVVRAKATKTIVAENVLTDLYNSFKGIENEI